MGGRSFRLQHLCAFLRRHLCAVLHSHFICAAFMCSYTPAPTKAAKVVLDIPKQEVHTALHAQPDLFAEAA
jgi:hypothetical protein